MNSTAGFQNIIQTKKKTEVSKRLTIKLAMIKINKDYYWGCGVLKKWT